MDRIEKSADSKFRFVLVAAKRAEQLMQGARPRITTDVSKIARIAMEEIIEKAVRWDYGPAPEEADPEPISSDESEAEGDLN